MFSHGHHMYDNTPSGDWLLAAGRAIGEIAQRAGIYVPHAILATRPPAAHVGHDCTSMCSLSGSVPVVYASPAHVAGSAQRNRVPEPAAMLSFLLYQFVAASVPCDTYYGTQGAGAHDLWLARTASVGFRGFADPKRRLMRVLKSTAAQLGHYPYVGQSYSLEWQEISWEGSYAQAATATVPMATFKPGNGRDPRDRWLAAAASLVCTYASSMGWIVPVKQYRVSVSHPDMVPSDGTQGQYWHHRELIWISPTVTSRVNVLAILLHEMIHAIQPTVGDDGTHGTKFTACASTLGLEVMNERGATRASEQLYRVLREYADYLGPYQA